jgi:hypothetical protein
MSKSNRKLNGKKPMDDIRGQLPGALSRVAGEIPHVTQEDYIPYPWCLDFVREHIKMKKEKDKEMKKKEEKEKRKKK